MSSLEELARRLGPAARVREPLSRHVSYRIGGPADLFVTARSAEPWIRAVEAAEALGVPWRILGTGSNMIIADEGIEGLVVKTSGGSFTSAPAETDGQVLVQADAGCILAALARRTALAGLAGLEWASNVPGTVGASVVNNSGAFGSCISEHLVSARLFSPGAGITEVPTPDLGYAYRTSCLKRKETVGVVLDATFAMQTGDQAELRRSLTEIRQARQSTQPSGFSVGSVFRNPDGAFSGQLIDAAGLKGFRVGNAEVSQLHANFVLNLGGAQARDVLGVVAHMQKTVAEKAGIWLEPEIELVGRWRPEDLQRLSIRAGVGAER